MKDYENEKTLKEQFEKETGKTYKESEQEYIEFLEYQVKERDLRIRTAMSMTEFDPKE